MNPTPSDFHFSPAQARAQLAFAWPGIVRRHRDLIDSALSQVDQDFIERFREEHPRKDTCAIARCGRHDLILRGLGHGRPVAYWVEGRLLGAYTPFGIFASDLAPAPAADTAALAA